jgi:catechol 2,3-dioxygenase-like lactoylglutathione lyase family enzyme
MKKLLLLLLIFMKTLANAQTPQPEGFKEAVFSVSDIARETQFYEQVAGWKVFYKATKQQNPLWKGLIYDEVLLKNEGDSTGFLRLVQFIDIEQKVMRSGAKTWDNGGHFDIDVRVKDLDAKKKLMEKWGWNAYGRTERYQFGKFDVSEVLMQGANGIVIALIQRHSPPLEGWNTLRDFSYIFNSAQIVKDIDKTAAFYAQLGFKTYMKSTTQGRGENILGIPPSIDTQTQHKVIILHPQGKNIGSVEPIQIEGLTGGEDFSERAIAPNLGILTLRFPVKNIDAYAEELKKKGIKIDILPTKYTLKPYGETKMMSLKTPDGAILEFFEL